MVNIENVESQEISIVLDMLGESLAKYKPTGYFSPDIKALETFIARIRDNGEIASDLRRYAKEILENDK